MGTFNGIIGSVTAYSLAALAGKNRSTSTGRGTFTKRVFQRFSFAMTV